MTNPSSEIKRFWTYSNTPKASPETTTALDQIRQRVQEWVEVWEIEDIRTDISQFFTTKYTGILSQEKLLARKHVTEHDRKPKLNELKVAYKIDWYDVNLFANEAKSTLEKFWDEIWVGQDIYKLDILLSHLFKTIKGEYKGLYKDLTDVKSKDVNVWIQTKERPLVYQIKLNTEKKERWIKINQIKIIQLKPWQNVSRMNPRDVIQLNNDLRKYTEAKELKDNFEKDSGFKIIK